MGRFILDRLDPRIREDDIRMSLYTFNFTLYTLHMSFVVKQQTFEGPLDLLLSLIEKRKLHINDISLANVADDYIEYLKSLGQFPIGDSANFILIASTLLLIKSKSLLPNLVLTEEEQGNVEDLERRLKILENIKALSAHVKERFGNNIIFTPLVRKREPVFSPDQSMTLPNIIVALRTVLANVPKKELLPQVIVKKIISLEDMIESLTKRVTTSLNMSFREFAKIGTHEKVNVIVSFLAMLELVKQGVISVNQESQFQDIHMESQNLGIPKYL